MAWQFVNTGYQSGSENMRVDGELVQTLTTGGDECFVRVYGWSPWAVSLGWNQSLEAIELEKTARAGIDVVRRPTGGRAILHADELTYSVAMVADSKSVAGVYHEISRALVGGLRLLGVRAVLEKSQPNFPRVYRSSSSAACFISSARYEVKVDGKKIVGSAQRRYAREDGREAVLQHGSILLGREHSRLGEFLRLSDQQKRTVKEELEARTTDLSTVLGGSVRFEEVAEAIRLGFEHTWQIHFHEIPVRAD